MLVRFFDPDAGTILLDGKRIQDMTLSSLRRLVLLMLQDDYVIKDTVRNNIIYGAHRVSEEAVRCAAREAGLDFVQELDSRIGDGREFSVGETQRIALARAFSGLRKSSFLTNRPRLSTVKPRRG